MLIGVLPLLAFFGIKNFNDITKLFENTEVPKEITFTNEPGYKVLLLRFQPYENCTLQENKIEIAIRDRLLEKSEEEELGLQVLFDTIQPWPKTFADARKIGAKKGADLVIWGDLYERCYSDSEASLSYVIVNSSSYGVEQKGKSTTETLISLEDIKKNGQLQKDVDFVIYWTLGLQAHEKNDCERTQFYFENIFQKFPDKASDSYFILSIKTKLDYIKSYKEKS